MRIIFFCFFTESCWDVDEYVVSLIQSIYSETFVHHFRHDCRDKKKDVCGKALNVSEIR